MLNIFTPLFRKGNIKTVSDSIPKEKDINHIVVISKERKDLIDECKELKLKYYLIDNPDSIESVVIKLNKGLEIITSGFFYGLDDDTTLHENVYKLYTQYKNTHKMIIGKQVHIHKGRVETRLNETIPECCKIDGAQALIHISLAKQVKIKSFNESVCADGLFLLDCWNSCKENQRILTKEVISNYNFLR
jgi:hypothetical protein